MSAVVCAHRARRVRDPRPAVAERLCAPPRWAAIGSGRARHRSGARRRTGAGGGRDRSDRLRPGLAADIGFGLSTFATAGLLLIAPHWRDALLRRRVPRGAAEALAVPAAAQVACSPLIAGFSGTVSIIAVPANLVAIPAVPAATILGVAAAVISPLWPSGAAFLAWLASWPARWLLVVAERGAAAPAAVAAVAQRCMGCAGSGRDPGRRHRRRPAPTGSASSPA